MHDDYSDQNNIWLTIILICCFVSLSASGTYWLVKSANKKTEPLVLFQNTECDA